MEYATDARGSCEATEGAAPTGVARGAGAGGAGEGASQPRLKRVSTSLVGPP